MCVLAFHEASAKISLKRSPDIGRVDPNTFHLHSGGQGSQIIVKMFDACAKHVLVIAMPKIRVLHFLLFGYNMKTIEALRCSAHRQACRETEVDLMQRWGLQRWGAARSTLRYLFGFPAAGILHT
jgi:hypothetical protein